jgi:hypothetical protein
MKTGFFLERYRDYTDYMLFVGVLGVVVRGYLEGAGRGEGNLCVVYTRVYVAFCGGNRFIIG